MPELPDIEIFSRNLHKALKGKKIVKLTVKDDRKLKHSAKSLSAAMKGKKIMMVYRSGKELRILLSDQTIIGIHLMLTGDLFLFNGKNERKLTLVEWSFDDGSGMALTDRMRNAQVTIAPEEKAGIDALDRKLNFSRLKEILNRKANIKNVLLDQDRIRGIGNGYSDEILWKCRISPFSVAAALPDEKIRELSRTIKSVLNGAIRKIDKKYPGLVQGEVRDFMQIHTKSKTASPTGAPIKTADRGMLKTYYTDEQVLYK